jgi:hypothetical protein
MPDVLNSVPIEALAERWILRRLNDPFDTMPTGGSLLSPDEVQRVNELIKTAKVSVTFDV